jgi:hypothetical protein
MMNILSGVKDLFTDAVFLFCLICLGVMCWKCAYVGQAGFAAFFTAVPAILAYTKHKIAIAQMQQPPPTNLPPGGIL